jgi:hypothetical protein
MDTINMKPSVSLKPKELSKLRPAIDVIELSMHGVYGKQAKHNPDGYKGIDKAKEELLKVLGNILVESGARIDYLTEFDKLLGK